VFEVLVLVVLLVLPEELSLRNSFRLSSLSLSSLDTETCSVFLTGCDADKLVAWEEERGVSSESKSDKSLSLSLELTCGDNDIGTTGSDPPDDDKVVVGKECLGVGDECEEERTLNPFLSRGSLCLGSGVDGLGLLPSSFITIFLVTLVFGAS